MNTFHRGMKVFCVGFRKRNDEGVRILSGDTNLGMPMQLKNSTKVRAKCNGVPGSDEYLVVEKNITQGVNSFQMLY